MLRTLLAALVAAFLFSPAHAETASWYGPGFHGKRTASGEIFNQNALTCASRKYPFGTRLRITYFKKSAVCRVNDYGPAKKTHRDLDLSLGTAKAIGMVGAGVAYVIVEKE